MRTVPNDSIQSVGIMEVIKRYKWKEIVIIASTDPYALGLASSIQALSKKYKVKILASIFFTSGQTDLTVELKALLETRARIIIPLMQVTDFQVTFNFIFQFQLEFLV
jgi:ABC-type branched-subunit amino acid transport system substrate-binding protein